MKSQKGFTAIELILVLVLAFGAIGWGMNLYKLASCDFNAPYKAEVIHGVGLVPFVGAFTGYMNFGK